MFTAPFEHGIKLSSREPAGRIAINPREPLGMPPLGTGITAGLQLILTHSAITISIKSLNHPLCAISGARIAGSHNLRRC